MYLSTPIFNSKGLLWLININKFRIIDNSMSKTSQKNMFMLGIFAYVVNEIKHGVEVKQQLTIFGNKPSMFHLNHNSLFIDLCDSSNDNKTFPNSSYLSTSSPLNHFGLYESLKSIPFLVSTNTSYVLNVVDCLWAMFRAPHITSKLCFSKY
jgi:hypothetical protein